MTTRRFKGASELVTFFTVFGKEVVVRMEMTFREGANDTKKYARDLLSGIYRKEDLNRFGNPYGRSAAFPFKALPINVDTGRLRDSLKFTWSSRNGVTTYRISNTAPYSAFILSPTGTRNMITRPFWDALDIYYSEQVKRKLLKTFEELHR